LERNPFRINLIGIAVGDPCTDNMAQQDSMDALWYSNKYGLMDDQLYDTLWNKCHIRIPFPSYLRDGTVQIQSLLQRGNSSDRNTRPPKQVTLQHIQEQIALYSVQRHHRQLRNKGNNDQSDLADHHLVTECDLAMKKFLFSSSNALSQGWEELYINDYNLYGFVSSEEDDAMGQYMNRHDVREALHVLETPHVQQWPYPDAGFDYTKEYNACNDDAIHTNASSMIDIYRIIIPYLQKGGTYIYNGDTDPCVSYEGTRTAVKRIGLSELDGGSYRPWFYNHTATTLQLLQAKALNFGPTLVVQEAGVQFGGEVITYESNLTFLTIHGSGHMVPQFRPQAAFHMMFTLLQHTLLSPHFPSNTTLTHASDSEFLHLLDDWTIRAKSKPFV
jgi:serine carboxypeptidase-like clade I